MKRSEINQAIRAAEEFFAACRFHLPPLAFWTQEEWRRRSGLAEVVACHLGWDVTDFGLGDFSRQGLLLFTLRNGVAGNGCSGKPYAEKIMIAREEQKTILHYHRRKTEDIINRGGGRLCFRLFDREGERGLSPQPVRVSRDGMTTSVAAGETVTLNPGESLTLTSGLFHEFWAAKGTGPVLIGEVSSVNDDHHDNVFYDCRDRFPSIMEDEPPYRLLVGDVQAMPEKQ